eukprot:1161133-Pelagomonas_calceolata.AAC.17
MAIQCYIAQEDVTYSFMCRSLIMSFRDAPVCAARCRRVSFHDDAPVMMHDQFLMVLHYDAALAVHFCDHCDAPP